MKEEIKKDIKFILEGTINAFNQFDADTIMELSNHIIHSASIEQEEHTSMTAIIIYSIGKIILKGKIRRYPQEAWTSFVALTRKNLNCALQALNENNHKEFDKCLLNLQKAIIKVDNSFVEFADYVIQNAKIKKGTKVYEHGVSLKRVAEVFNVNEWELMDYAGKTNIQDRDDFKSEVKERLNKARSFFE